MRIHLIAIGGKVMHNLALELLAQGHQVSGSDDEIYDPARSRLKAAGILPATIGWDIKRISTKLDIIILGMHAHKDNPELAEAQRLGLKVVSFPEYIGEAIQGKKRIVVCGSHGKSTITAMIMHVLKHEKIESDYALGGMLEGFDRMVSLGDATIAVIEGDEYMSSRVDPRSKMMHYHGDVVIITGIEWDHVNVFPTFDIYVEQFQRLISQTIEENSKLIWYKLDEHLPDLMKDIAQEASISYEGLDHRAGAIEWENHLYDMQVFGQHNLANMNAARLACEEVGVSAEAFFNAMSSFRGVGNRLEKIHDDPIVYKDYAHAPSKLRATVAAVREKYPTKRILAIYELHTYSSLSVDFMPHYKDTMQPADRALVFYDKHALAMKRLPDLQPESVQEGFGAGVLVLREVNKLHEFLLEAKDEYDVILLMSSGTFAGLPIQQLFPS